MTTHNDKIARLKASSLGGINPSEATISTYEKEIGWKLPAGYLQIVSEHGCWCTPLGYTYFRYREPYPGGDRGMLNVFFGILPGDSYDLLDNYRCYRGRIPRNMIPIANDPGGNLICLSLADPNKGYVYFWDHETEASALGYPREASYSNMYLVAESLDDFIGSLEFVQDTEQ